MALGYEIGTIMKRTSTSYSDDRVTVKLDDIEGMDRTFVQVQGKERDLVARVGGLLGLDGTYIPRSYIEQVRVRGPGNCSQGNSRSGGEKSAV